MIPATTFEGRKVAVFGLGGSGVATVAALKAGGADVLAWDDGPVSRERARGHGITITDLDRADWADFAALILSPGIPLTHPEPHWTVLRARSAGVEVIGDIELFCRERAKIAPNAPFVAITGTNGKSTTTALVAHILRTAGRDVQMGGNIGTAILSLEPPANERVHVIEMSSFQIDLTPTLKPSIGVLLNISPDHLDRHGTMENYAAIKRRLAVAAELAIVGIEDVQARHVAEGLARGDSGFLTISASEGGSDLPAPHYCVEGSRIVRAALHGREGGSQVTVHHPPGPLADLSGASALRGRHNAQNACAASGVATALGVDDHTIALAMQTFPGLPHRMEEVGYRGEVLFINDSKATNADSTEKALASFEHIFWILGGRPKEGGIEGLNRFFTKIEKAYLIGEATESFAAALDGQVAFVRCGTLDKAVRAAADDAAERAGQGVVLLSPACASYDQYPNFEVRGDHFRDLVRALPGLIPGHRPRGSEAKGAGR